MKPTLHLNAFNPQPFAARRARLAEKMRELVPSGASVAIIQTAPEVARNRDAHYVFRAGSYFY